VCVVSVPKEPPTPRLSCVSFSFSLNANLASAPPRDPAAASAQSPRSVAAVGRSTTTSAPSAAAAQSAGRRSASGKKPLAVTHEHVAPATYRITLMFRTCVVVSSSSSTTFFLTASRNARLATRGVARVRATSTTRGFGVFPDWLCVRRAPLKRAASRS
jgi:hypothetical protein